MLLQAEEQATGQVVAQMVKAMLGVLGTGPAHLETQADAVTMLTFLLPSQIWDNSMSWVFSTKIIRSEMAYNIII